MSTAPHESVFGGASFRTRELHRQYSGPIFSYCRRRLPSQEEAEDAAQLVFLNAHRSLEQGVRPISDGAWLFKIAENVVMYRRRTLFRRSRVEYPIDLDGIADQVAAPNREIPPEAVGLVDALGRLPLMQQRAIVLREWQGLSYREIAYELGISNSAVETLIFRARRSLAAELEQPERRASKLRGLVSPLLLGKWFLGTGPATKVAASAASLVALAFAGGEVGVLPLVPVPGLPHLRSHQSTPAAPAVREPASLPMHLAPHQVLVHRVDHPKSNWHHLAASPTERTPVMRWTEPVDRLGGTPGETPPATPAAPVDPAPPSVTDGGDTGAGPAAAATTDPTTTTTPAVPATAPPMTTGSETTSGSDPNGKPTDAPVRDGSANAGGSASDPPAQQPRQPQQPPQAQRSEPPPEGQPHGTGQPADGTVPHGALQSQGNDPAPSGHAPAETPAPPASTQ